MDSTRKRNRLEDEEDVEVGEENGVNKRLKQETTISRSSSVRHLDQIQRSNLDFDFEKVCSVTLSPRSVYCCLVCGKFFQGRTKGSPLFLHAIETSHFVAINLGSAQIYVLPEGELVTDRTLDDIKYNLRPTYSDNEISSLSQRIQSVKDHRPPLRDLHGNRYFPGLVGLNDLSNTDFINSVVQALVRVGKLREFFLRRSPIWEESESRVTRAFGELCCQLFSGKRFKHTASPHELVQAIVSAGHGRFQVGKRADASQFLAWLLFELHKGCGGTKKAMSSIIHECFQGEVRVQTTVIELKRDFDREEETGGGVARAGPALPGGSTGRNNREDEEKNKIGTFTRAQVVSTTEEHVPFLFLSLDLPTNPLFTDAMEGETVIPRTTLLEILRKYDGETTVDVALPGGRLEQKRYRVTRLPEYLVFHLKRFTKNQFFTEKNRAVVSLPLANMDMRPYYHPLAPNQDSGDQGTKYDLIANVCHDGGVGPGVKDAITDGSYRANVYYPPQDGWFECQDLTVRHVSMPQLVSVSETFLAIYERQQ